MLSRVQDAFADVKAEIRQLLADHGVTKMSIRPVRRSYAFEDRAVAAGEQWVLKVKYPGNQAALPAGLRGADCCRSFLMSNPSQHATNKSRRRGCRCRHKATPQCWLGVFRRQLIRGRFRRGTEPAGVRAPQAEGHGAVVAAAEAPRSHASDITGT